MSRIEAANDNQKPEEPEDRRTSLRVALLRNMGRTLGVIGATGPFTPQSQRLLEIVLRTFD